MRYKYTVRGPGAFPLDMLRYDTAWPRMPEDVNAIRASCNGDTEGIPWTVELSSPSAPTAGRWRSFAWPVIAGPTKY